jgi:hypothetical protein
MEPGSNSSSTVASRARPRSQALSKTYPCAEVIASIVCDRPAWRLSESCDRIRGRLGKPQCVARPGDDPVRRKRVRGSGDLGDAIEAPRSRASTATQSSRNRQARHFEERCRGDNLLVGPDPEYVVSAQSLQPPAPPRSEARLSPLRELLVCPSPKRWNRAGKSRERKNMGHPFSLN